MSFGSHFNALQSLPTVTDCNGKPLTIRCCVTVLHPAVLIASLIVMHINAHAEKNFLLSILNNTGFTPSFFTDSIVLRDFTFQYLLGYIIANITFHVNYHLPFICYLFIKMSNNICKYFSFMLQCLKGR